MALPFDLKNHHWWQVPDVGNSQLADVYASPNPGGDQSQIMTAWGGACVDTSRKDLIVWGGGHQDYSGNEVYAFNFDPASGNYLTWRRKTYYSTPANDDSESNSDGSPASRHTYAGLLYDAARDTMVVAPGGFLAGLTGIRSSRAWEFACSTESPSTAAPSAWTQKDQAPTITPGSGPEPFMSMAYDPVSGLYFTQHGRGFARFNPAASPGSQWTGLTDFEGPVITDDMCCVATIGPPRIMWASIAGGGDVFARNLQSNAYINSESAGVNATGDVNVFDSAFCGFGWEPVLQCALAWAGTVTGGLSNRDVYAYEPNSNKCVRIPGYGDTPGNPNSNGTFGRWAYLGGCGAAYRGLWILVNTTTSHVYFYRSSGNPDPFPADLSKHPIARSARGVGLPGLLNVRNWY